MTEREQRRLEIAHDAAGPTPHKSAPHWSNRTRSHEERLAEFRVQVLDALIIAGGTWEWKDLDDD